MRILFVDIDTLRPDHMGCYGYGSLHLPYVLDCPSSLVREWLCTGYLMSSQIPTG